MNLTADTAHGRSIALMKFLSDVARKHGVAEHVYVVGGAVRNFLIGQPIKDIDVVVDSIGLNGKDSAWFAKEVAQAIPVRTNLTTNQYGVAILTVSEPWMLDGYQMKGETIEVANARKESYGGEGGKGYKPHTVEPATIEEDLARREFTFNTLLWRLLDLEHGPEKAEVLDLTGLGKKHLEDRILSTPVNPDKTFSDDPTRMLRAIKFVAKYGFKIPSDVAESIRRNAASLKKMPWDAVRKILTQDILEGPAPRRSVVLLKELGLADVLKAMLAEEPGFASALGRSLSSGPVDAHLMLDLLDLGWVVKTPLSFLDADGLARLREILFSHADNPRFESALVSALIKPPVDQQHFFVEFAIPPKERQVVVQVARRLILADPDLVDQGLVEAVESDLATKYTRASAPERIATKFLLR
jgi:tRNA nucleotidyltransferase/poly(A) polymerase